MRPEVIIPLADQQDPLAISIPHKEQGLCIGNPVRVIRDPYFGRLGKVAELPSELMRVETEAKVRIMKVELANGEIITVPRANVETIEV
jgi:transcription antitermination factor NusG